MVFNTPKRIKGLTLVELLIAAALLGFVMLTLGYIFINHFKFFQDQSALITITEDNKVVLDEMINQIRESQSIVASCTPCGPDTTGANLIILQIWPLNATNEPFDGGTNFDYIQYKRDATDNTILKKIVYPTATSTRSSLNKIVATRVSDLTFTYNNATPAQATEVTAKIKLSATTGSKTQDIEREATALLRNK
ncbi:MAG: prepilin-type N-terminal cleavage/methylation domain-containing protein [Patescibacteria group bacterium]